MLAPRDQAEAQGGDGTARQSDRAVLEGRMLPRSLELTDSRNVPCAHVPEGKPNMVRRAPSRIHSKHFIEGLEVLG